MAATSGQQMHQTMPPASRQAHSTLWTLLQERSLCPQHWVPVHNVARQGRWRFKKKRVHRIQRAKPLQRPLLCAMHSSDGWCTHAMRDPVCAGNQSSPSEQHTSISPVSRHDVRTLQQVSVLAAVRHRAAAVEAAEALSLESNPELGCINSLNAGSAVAHQPYATGALLHGKNSKRVWRPQLRLLCARTAWQAAQLPHTEQVAGRAVLQLTLAADLVDLIPPCCSSHGGEKGWSELECWRQCTRVCEKPSVHMPMVPATLPGRQQTLS